MKPPAAWMEVSLLAAGLLVAMLVVMWIQRPAEGCTMSPEAPRRLVLSRETDREHLATDLASADRIARRDMRSAGDDAGQRARFAACQASLAQQIATLHGLSPDLVRGGHTDAP